MFRSRARKAPNASNLYETRGGLGQRDNHWLICGSRVTFHRMDPGLFMMLDGISEDLMRPGAAACNTHGLMDIPAKSSMTRRERTFARCT